MELSESPATPADDTSTRSGGPSPVFDSSPGNPGVVENLGQRPVAQGLMGPLVFVEPDVGSQFPSGLGGVGIGFQLQLLVFHGAPQPLHQNVVAVAPFPVHAVIFTQCSCSAWMNSPLVNCCPDGC